MLPKRKSHEEIEAIALQELRHKKDRKLLNNTNVDCFIDGFKLAQDIFTRSEDVTKEFLQEIIERLDQRYRDIEDSAGYGGRCFTKDEISETELIAKVKATLKTLLGELDSKTDKG